MNSLEVVRRHFDRDAERFDAIYEERKPLLHRWVDRLRSVVVERFRLVCVLAPTAGRWSVLDVGCGPGRYGIALSKLGAGRIVGLDVSDAMIELARTESGRSGTGADFEFVASDYLSWEGTESFDVLLAMGYFDYLEDPAAHLRRMRQQCHGRIFASIPKRWEWRVPIRKMRFLLARGFVRFYSRADAERLLAEAGVPRDHAFLIDLGRDWLLVVNAGDDPPIRNFP